MLSRPGQTKGCRASQEEEKEDRDLSTDPVVGSTGGAEVVETTSVSYPFRKETSNFWAIQHVARRLTEYLQLNFPGYY
jgi:hypothetical protein